MSVIKKLCVFSWLRRKPLPLPLSPEEVRPVPLCEDCKFYCPDRPGPQFGKCSHPRVSNESAWRLVSALARATEDMKFCANARHPTSACGPKGQLFEAVPKPEMPKRDSEELVTLRCIYNEVLAMKSDLTALRTHLVFEPLKQSPKKAPRKR